MSIFYRTMTAADWARDAVVASGDIDADTTDAQLEKLTDQWLEQAEIEGVAIKYGDLLFWLRDARDWVRDRPK